MRPDLSTVLAAEGPFVSVYLATPSTDPNAADQLELRWKNVRRSLEEEGADDETLAAIDEIVVGERGGVARQVAGPVGDGVDDVHSGNKPADRSTFGGRDNRGRHADGGTLAVVAAGGQVLLATGLATEPAGELDHYRLGLVPWLIPFLEAEAARIPYLVVRLDRAGADITGHRRRGGEVEETVQGSDAAIGRKHQRRAVDSWNTNAGEVAAEVAELGDRLSARAVLVGGDVAIGALFEEALPDRMKGLVRHLEHTSRGEDGPDDAAEAEIAEVVAGMVHAETEVVLAEWREERGQGDRAAETHGRVVEALQMHLVQTLLVHEDVDDARMAWFGPEPGLIGLQRSDLESMGVEHPEEARLVDICVRAALGTGADVRVVTPDELTDGLGAILRTALRADRPAT